MVQLNKHKRKIATYFTRIIVSVVGLLTIGVLFQNYQMSSNVINQEVARTAEKTEILLQSLFDYRLSLLRIQQDSNAKNNVLLEAFHAKSGREVEHYFQQVDQLDSDYVPDIRFITDLNHVAWDDGSAQFFSISPSALQSVFEHVSLNDIWNFITVKNVHQETIFLLARRTPLIKDSTQELLGYLVFVSVLNNNFTLMEALRTQSDASNLLFTTGSTIIASTLDGRESKQYRRFVFAGGDNSSFKDNHLVKLDLRIDGVLSPLSLTAIQDNPNLQVLKRNFYLGLLFIFVSVGAASWIMWHRLHRNIRQEIEHLMQFSHGIVEHGKNPMFKGSSIEEFDHFGRVLELTFRQLADQEKQFENLFNYSISPTILWTPEGNLIRMNPAAISQFTIEKAGATKQFYELKRSLLPKITQVAKGLVLEEVVTFVAGKTYRWSISPVVIDHKIESILTQGQDVTTIADAEKQSQLARLAAERAAQSRADFLARMSHEVRTPLNGILGVTQLLQSQITNPKHLEQLDVLNSSSEHLLAVLNDILDFSKMEQNQFRINLLATNMDVTINAIKNTYAPLCEQKKLAFNVESNIEDGILVVTDAIRLNQIVFNLLNNAIKFTHSGQVSVVFDLNLDSSKGLSNLLTIHVIDSGIGISQNDRDAIFEPFIQAETSSSREFGGTGLGLSIVKSLVHLFGGDISVSSELGKGSHFKVELPVRVVKQTSENASLQIDNNEGLTFSTRPRVLLVEDNKTNAYIAKAFCEKYGVDVEWVTEGSYAIELVKKERFDFVLMDYQLPNMDGLEATMMIKSIHPELAICACTADGMQETQQAFMRAGAEHVLVKPIREDAFKDVLRWLINRKSTQ